MVMAGDNTLLLMMMQQASHTAVHRALAWQGQLVL
jgi:hypothetical protein